MLDLSGLTTLFSGRGRAASKPAVAKERESHAIPRAAATGWLGDAFACQARR